MEQVNTYLSRVRSLLRDEDGAITVDWVVLTAVILALGIASAFAVGANIPGLADAISQTVANRPVS